jgi:hypothetical protein
MPKGLDASTIKRKARVHQLKIQSHLQKSIPTSGDQIGKRIEKRISASQKIWRNAGIALFSQKALENVSHFSRLSLGILMLILADLILIFPTEKKAFAMSVMVPNFFLVLAGLFVINGVTYAAMRAMGSKTSFRVFFSTVNVALFMSLLIISIPVALVSFALFSTMLRSQAAVTMFFSLIPFYNYLIYGWASESLGRLKGLKSILLALIALILIMFLNLVVQQIMA